VDRSLALLLAALAGAVISAQSPPNVALGNVIGPLRASFVQFVVGTVLMGVVVALFAGGFGGILEDRTAWHYLGGITAAIFVTLAILTLKPLGLTLQFAGIITGQVIGALAIDHFGLLGVQRRPIGLLHLVGLALMGAGLVVVTRASR
jgi:bacterial/archaeal transporter family-2 protein